MELAPWFELVRPLFEGKRVIVAVQTPAAADATVRQVLKFGATEVLVVAARSSGLGPNPTEAGAMVIEIGATDDGSSLGMIRACQQAIRSLPQWVVEAIDRFDPDPGDPDRAAVVLGDFLTETPTLAGRRFVFHRRPEWIALDDKTGVDALWDRVGIERAPSTVVVATGEAVADVFDRFDQGDGIVVAVDSSDGWTGGAEGTRWVPTVGRTADALRGWERPGRRVRVMPFLEGIPCSIHGVVFDDYVIALRPVEMIVLRTEDQGFFYAGCCSFFDPPDGDREAMRALARRVGAALRDTIGFRGAFTVDGVLSDAGFRPTELNPRNGAGLMTMERTYGQPLHLLIDLIASGHAALWRPADLEAELLAAYDARRGGGTWARTPRGSADVPTEGRVRFTDTGVEPVPEYEPADLVFVSNVSEKGTFLRAVLQQEWVRPGPPVAPLAASFWNWADTTWGLGLGRLTPARPC
jgi:hypothetical protein